MALIKQTVLSAIEQTNGTSPKDVLAKARELPPAKDTRVFVRDYVPAMEALVKKGYPIRESARLLVDLGCPFAPGTLALAFNNKKKGKTRWD